MLNWQHLSAIKRCLLGIFLITLACAVLLYSDWDQRVGTRRRIPQVAVLQHVSQPLLDDGVAGILDGLADAGFVNGKNIAIRRYNAENDLATANAIAKQITSGQYDMVLTSSTLSLQSVANANRAGRAIHVFGIVADPASAGVGISRENPLDHPKHLVGIGTFLPVKPAFEMAKRLNPELKSIGVAWNPGESNSEAFTKKAREASRELGIELMEATIENSSGVLEAASALVARGAQALWVGGDVTVMVAIDSVVAAARKGGIPVFSIVPPCVDRGSLFDLGANFYEVGKDTGALAASILKGADPAKIPVRNVVPGKLLVNKLALNGLKQQWRLPDDLVASADVVIDETGKHEKAARRPLARKWKIGMIELNNVLDVEETEQGVMAGFKESGLVEGRDYELQKQNAQGDMATVNTLVDNALAQGADLLITLSTPTLQAAMQRAQNRPVVFTYVASAVAAGAGKNAKDHLPNVTGVEFTSAFDEMIPVIRRLIPATTKLGTIFVPSEVNSVFYKDELLKAAKQAGLEVVALPASTSSEVPDAALAMTTRGVQAICQIPGNLTAAAFASIAHAAAQAKVPVFAFQTSQAHDGAAVVLSRDYIEAGKMSAAMAAKIMRGENPATMPFQAVTKTRLIVNLPAARNARLDLPQDLVQKAEQVIR
jgi:ABC-type uncharacterized transport system substrate-binding protein